jgi:hypothetical protein
MHLLLLSVIAAGLAFAQVNDLGPQHELRSKPDLRLWKVSAATLAGASALDIASSWGRCCERNPLLSSVDGRFGGRALAVKSTALGGQLLMQYLVVRKSPKLARVLGYVNFGGAGVLTGVAIRNFRIPQPHAAVR